MKKLSKAQEKTKDEIIAELNKAKQAVTDAFADVAAVMDEKLAPAIEAYNEALTAVTEFRDEIVNDMQSYFSERSEKWQEGDAGSSYQSWISDWENWDNSELDAIEQPQEPSMDHPDEFENLSNETE